MNRPNDAESNRNPYRGVVILLLAGAAAGSAGALNAGATLGNPVLYAVAVTFGISAGVLAGVLAALILRSRPTAVEEVTPTAVPVEESRASDGALAPVEGVLAPAESAALPAEATPVPVKATSRRPEILLWERLKPLLESLRGRFRQWFQDLGLAGTIRVATAIFGALAILDLLWSGLPMNAVTGLAGYIEAAAVLGVAGLVAVACRYLAGIEPAQLPESPGLLRGARVVAWTLVLAALSVGAGWFSQWTILQILFYAILLIDAAICYGLFMVKSPAGEASGTFPLDIGVLYVLGSRPNILASVQDTVETQFGIDLRSTWALTVVRRGLEPLVIGLCLVGWLSTSMTVVGPDEQGLVERSGVPLTGPPLEPGLHVHWPWPVDRVFRIPVKRVQLLHIGHDEEAGAGPENTIWAVKHAENEFTLLLGNGRDLLSIDAALYIRINDARAWRYHCQNPADLLKALGYRAVTRSIINRTLADALSENIASWTGQIKAEVQREADTLGLGVEVLGFEVGGMHPPVPVAEEYEAVVSAELRKVTAVVNAQAYRNRSLPDAQASILMGESTARSEAADALAKAAGEAWSFRALESQYRASPEEYYFRRRLETLEKGLTASPFTVVDTRIQRDGGELWVTP